MSDFVDGWCPTPPARVENDWRQNIAKYGDGYEQRELDGLHALNRRWSVDYQTREQAEITAMEAYLVLKGGQAFPFKDPATGVVHQVVCDGWQVDWSMVRFFSGGGRQVYGTLSAVFRLAYGVA